MKKILFINALIAVLAFSACEKDNYDEPDATLKGAILYNGDTLRLQNNEVTLHLFEMGWATSHSTRMTVSVNQDGMFNAKIFSGRTYKMIRSEVGPWDNPAAADTLTFTAGGNTVQNVEVRPYFLLKNVHIQMQAATVEGEMPSVNASFDVQQIDPDAQVESMALLINENYIIDITRSSGLCSKKGVTPVNLNATNTITTSLDESLDKYSFVYARVGLKIRDTTALLYSQVVKIPIK